MRPPRNEYKYFIYKKQKDLLLEFWSRYLVKDPYTDKLGKTPILSMYYDTQDLLFYYEKLDGIQDRNKVRLRVYDYSFKEGIPCFLEMKQRFGDKVRKLRVFEENFTQDLFDLEKWKFKENAGRHYFGEVMSRYYLRPVAQVFYMRDAYQALVEKDVRVTFDTSLMGFHPYQKITKELLVEKENSLMSEEMCILEIKNNSGDIPKWILTGIEKMGLVQRSIPKYISAVEKLKINDFKLNTGEYL